MWLLDKNYAVTTKLSNFARIVPKCPKETLAPVPKCTLRTCRSVLGPKFGRSEVSWVRSVWSSLCVTSLLGSVTSAISVASDGLSSKTSDSSANEPECTVDRLANSLLRLLRWVDNEPHWCPLQQPWCLQQPPCSWVRPAAEWPAQPPPAPSEATDFRECVSRNSWWLDVDNTAPDCWNRDKLCGIKSCALLDFCVEYSDRADPELAFLLPSPKCFFSNFAIAQHRLSSDNNNFRFPCDPTN